MKKAILLFSMIFALIILSGCSITAVDELYSLPKTSEQYLQLEELALHEKALGFDYSAPISGNYRQSILLSDLDNDGQDEALAFFRDSEQTLKICIYSHGNSEDFELVSTIDGEGTSIRRVDFADMDGDGRPELLVLWQISADIRVLNVYSLDGWNASELLSVSNCTEFRFADMDGDSCSDLMVLNFSATEQGSLSLYKLSRDREIIPSVAKLSPGITSLVRLRAGSIGKNVTAIFAEGVMEDGTYITDIFIDRDGELVSLTADKLTGVSSARRSYEVYSADIDNDKYLEVPFTVRLYSQTEGFAGYQRFDWYSYDEYGNSTMDISTYHCYSDDWYIILPNDIRENLTLRREDRVTGERVVVFSVYDQQEDSVTDLMIIYKLTGDNRHDRAKLENRFVLLENYTSIYAAEILYDGSGDIAPFTSEDVKKNFSLIYMEWNVGAL